MDYVDFEITKVPKYRVASLFRLGPWQSEDMMRPYFRRITSWARNNNVKTGMWIITEKGSPSSASNTRGYEASVEIKQQRSKKNSDLKEQDGINLKILPAETVARIKFNPDLVSARLVYHGLEAWLEWRKRYGEYERSRAYTSREVYLDDPWQSKAAWQNMEVQVPIKKL